MDLPNASADPDSRLGRAAEEQGKGEGGLVDWVGEVREDSNQPSTQISRTNSSQSNRLFERTLKQHKVKVCERGRKTRKPSVQERNVVRRWWVWRRIGWLREVTAPMAAAFRCSAVARLRSELINERLEHVVDEFLVLLVAVGRLALCVIIAPDSNAHRLVRPNKRTVDQSYRHTVRQSDRQTGRQCEINRLTPTWGNSNGTSNASTISLVWLNIGHAFSP